jgi:uncharacterized membrane protein
MTYCAKCGSPVEGKFCAKCGSPVAAAPGAAPPPGVPPPPAANPGLGMEENVAAALCYIPIVGLIFLLVEPYNKNRNIKFHAMQSLFYCVAWIVVVICLGIVGGIMFAMMPFGMWSLWILVTRLAQLALFVGLVIMAVKAYQGSRFVMPIIGPLAEKQAG